MAKKIKKENIQNEEPAVTPVDGTPETSAETPETDTENEPPEDDDGTAMAEEDVNPNSWLREVMNTNFIEYASYVIKERAIPDVDDGLKPVQRRILWSMHRNDDGTFHKVANLVGYTMRFHPHGDASIYDALVVLANKEFFIEKQGNYGDITTGARAAAGRYIEARLSNLGREVLFNDDITETEPSYDGRDVEPVRLPIKIPALLLMGTDGIAVGTNTRILPHNFNEVLNAQIAILQGQPFQLFPDFFQGGIMDVSEYEDGNGKITLRARIEIEGRMLVITEVPALTDTHRLMDSIEKANTNGKIKLSKIQDLTAKNVRIEITLQRGYDPQRALQALYKYTDCSLPVSLNFMVIKENRPVRMNVTDVLKRNTEKLLEYLRAELNLSIGNLLDKLLIRTLAQIFVEERIYKKIENCKTYESVKNEVVKGLDKFKKEWMPIVLRLKENLEMRGVAEKNPDIARRLEQLSKGEIPTEELEKLLSIPIRRISLFDINKNHSEIEEINDQLAADEKNLAHLKSYAIKYLKHLLEEYGEMYPRHTEIVSEGFGKIDVSAIALNNIRVGWDRKGCYVGTNIKSEDIVVCNEFDHLLCVERKGGYKIIGIPDKIFIDKLYEFRKYDKTTVFGVVYSDMKTGKVYAKRTVIDKFIKDKEYRICPENCRLEVITPRPNAVYECRIDTPIKARQIQELNLSEMPMRSPHAGGQLVFPRKMLKITFMKYLDGTELPEDPNLIEPPPEAPDNGGSTPEGGAPEESPEVKKPKAKQQEKGKKEETEPIRPNPNDSDENWGITQPGFDF